MSQQDNVTYQQRLAIIQIISAAAMLIIAVLFSVGLTFAATGGNAIQSSFNSYGDKIENLGLYNFGESLKQNSLSWFTWASFGLGGTIMGSTCAIRWATNRMRKSIDPNYNHHNPNSHNQTESINEQSNSNVNTNQTYIVASETKISDIAPAYSKISLTGYTGNKYYATRKRFAYHPTDKQFKGTPKVETEITITKIKEKRGILPRGFKS